MEAERRAMQPGNRKCGAKTRKGTPCADIAMANGRCKRHGGKATGPKVPNTSAATEAARKVTTTHGIYSRFLTEEDRALYDAAEIGAVDAELRLMRMRLARTVKARAAWEAELRGEVDGRESDGSDSMTLVEVVEDQSQYEGAPVDLEKRVKRIPDFDKIEQTIVGRIESLEKTRKELLKLGDEDPPDGDPTARDHVSFSGGLDGGNDEELPSPFKAKVK